MVDLKNCIALILLIKFSNCEMEGRIVGGVYAKINDFPHAVFLYMDKSRNHWICGSSVLNQNILLTAAHCVHDCKTGCSIGAFAGHEDLKMVPVINKADKVKVHPTYNGTQLNHDIALVHLKNRLPLGNSIKRVVLKSLFPKNPGVCTVAGWGLVNEEPGKEKGTLLMKMVRQEVKTWEACSIIGLLEQDMLCAGSFNPKASQPSLGDSGSGLITKSLQVIGLVSFKLVTMPALIVYTNVSYYYNWIANESSILHCNK